jgi:lipopolysaccharide transport system ATP-binding protein
LASTSGNVEVRGRIAALLELGSGFNPEFTGRENVFLNGQILGLSRDEIKVRLDAIEDFAGIGDFIDQPVKTYSSGMVVRLAFSVVVHIEPDILVVDEALAVGDMPFQIKCFAHLRKLRENGTSILFVSHDLSTVRSFCDRVVYLDHGKCLAVGPSNEICRQYELSCLKDKFLPSKLQDFSVNNLGNLSEDNSAFVPHEILKCLQSKRFAFMKKERMGSNSLTIESFILVGQDGIPIESIEPIQNVTAYALIRFNESSYNDIHFSIQIHDRQGTPLMVLRDSNFEETLTGVMGDYFIAQMNFSLPLKAGQYYCQAGLLLFPPKQKYTNHSFNFDVAEISDLVEYSAYFKILPYDRHPIPVAVLNESKLALIKIKG